MRHRFPAFSLLVTLLLAAVLATACSGNSSPSPSGATPAGSSIDLSSYEARLSPEVWQQVEQASWYHDGKPTAAGVRLLDALVSPGGLAVDAQRLKMLADYPSGIDEETWETATAYARMALITPFEALTEAWLADGIDGYEKAVIAAAGQRVVSVSALHRALDDGMFRPNYEADPRSLTGVLIDAVGSLDPQILDYLKTQPWFSDGLDSYEISLLGILNSVVNVQEQLKILQQGNYRRLDLNGHSIAVLFEGSDHSLMDTSYEILRSWMPKMEDFLGPYKPTALIVDVTPDRSITFCHTGGGSEFRPSAISLPLPGCFRAPIVIHELAHAFIGGRYPPWFSEGVAEVVTYHLTGARSGYFGGSGTIDLEGRYLLAGAAYQNQAALGSDFLEDLYRLAGPEQMSAFIQDVEGRSLTGQNLLDRIRQMQVDSADLESLITRSFGAAVAGEATPAASTR